MYVSGNLKNKGQELWRGHMWSRLKLMEKNKIEKLMDMLGVEETITSLAKANGGYDHVVHSAEN